MNFFDVEECYHFVNFYGGGLNSAYISKSTGKTYLFSDDSDWADNKEELLEDIDCDDDYVAVPTQRELNLGQALIWEFVSKEIPGLEEKVRDIFSRKGAYRRFWNFLEYNGLRDKWHDFENARVKEVLIQWCEENGITLEDE